MPASVASICSRALQMMGAGSINSIDDNTARAQVMKIAYEPVRDAELRARRWRFAIKRTGTNGIAADAATPGGNDFARQFPLPGDCLRVIEGGSIRGYVDLSDYRDGCPGLYSVEGRMILTNLPAPLHLRYLARIADVSLFDATFCEVLSARLARKTYKRITESTATGDELKGIMAEALRDAVSANALERPPEAPADDSWVMCRLG